MAVFISLPSKISPLSFYFDGKPQGALINFVYNRSINDSHYKRMQRRTETRTWIQKRHFPPKADYCTVHLLTFANEGRPKYFFKNTRHMFGNKT